MQKTAVNWHEKPPIFNNYNSAAKKYVSRQQQRRSTNQVNNDAHIRADSLNNHFQAGADDNEYDMKID